VQVDVLVVFEIALAGLNFYTAWLSWSTGHYLIMVYTVFFAIGLLFTSGFTLLQSLSVRFKPDPGPASAKRVSS
jgi:hypothetical protein